MTYSCDGGATASLIPGVDQVDLVYSATPIADVIALSATVSNNGIVTVPQRANRVLTSTDPQHALEIMRRGEIDLVLADLMMPKLSGAKLIDQIKAISPHTPALLFSGSVNCCVEDTLADVWLPKGELVHGTAGTHPRAVDTQTRS